MVYECSVVGEYFAWTPANSPWVTLGRLTPYSQSLYLFNEALGSTLGNGGFNCVTGIEIKCLGKMFLA